MIPSCSIFGLPQNTTFCDIWGTEEEFITDYTTSGIYTVSQSSGTDTLDVDHARLLYYLLYSRYGNNSILSTDRNRFKYNVFSIMFQYGPGWVAKLDLQDKLRKLKDSDVDLTFGGKAIYNHAFNPGNAPSTNITREIPAINEQNVTIKDRDKLTAYAELYALLEDDVTEEFIGKFKKLFTKMVAPIKALTYPDVEEE